MHVSAQRHKVKETRKGKREGKKSHREKAVLQHRAYYHHAAICCHAPSTVSFHMVAALLASLTHRMLPATDHDKRQAGVLKSCSVV